MPAPTRDIEAAGAVVFRRPKGGRREVLLVHRPKYDDWAFPKGKLDRGEHATTAAVREVEEETGLLIRLGRPLRSQRYRVGRGWKLVHYWVGRVRAEVLNSVLSFPDAQEFVRYFCSTLLYEEIAEREGYSPADLIARCPAGGPIPVSKKMVAVAATKPA